MCIQNVLHRSSRFKSALKVVEHLLHSVRPASVWLAGHALGAAILVLVGKKMARKNFPLKTYLFNPPFVTLPLGRIKYRNLRDKLMILARLFIAATTATLNPPINVFQGQDEFKLLSSWEPNLYVNPEDDLCSGYISYFELRTLMQSIGAGKIEMIAMQNSLINLARKDPEADTVDTLPTACLTTNLCPSPDFGMAHGIQQWWDHRTQCQSVIHRFLPTEKKFEMIKMHPRHTQQRRGQKLSPKL
ncbi:hypothetical protein ACJRO7_001441 [Eucalyptus globulus]|uniref:Fungal lipase-like domain-containing protein n=1 Tax=Eucalyptus globulus TaxID=34317 RepID=A0ABD3LW72_EUCGL